MNILLCIILGIIFVNFCLDKYLDYRNICSASNTLPNEVKDVYDNREYNKQQHYLVTNTKFSFITDTVNTLISMCLFGFCIYGLLYNYFYNLTNNTFISDILLMVTFTLFITLINIPFKVYDTFVIEKRFEFNKTTPTLFIKDTLISTILSLAISLLVFSTIYWMYELFGMWFILTAFAFVMLFSFTMTFLYSDLIVPLFNKQTPLEEGELRNAIVEFTNKVGFNISNIYVLDSSKRTTKPNAYFTGFGKKKRIVLYDTLINKLTIDEVVAVLAHEIGHYKHKHVLKSFIIGGIDTLINFSLLAIILQNISTFNIMNNDAYSLYIIVVIFGVLKTPLSIIMHLVSSYFIRKYEYEADMFVKNNGYAKYLISSLKKLSKHSLSNLTPDKWYVIFNYSHPTLVQRIRNVSDQ